ncbi:hypothetical protein AVEN_53286-1 [Araneus ventricosus]|uniref:Tc1-like transposase DDE domain-containing protein n=1 Tax=Araneus ventricosus TaxID=182803 RepID=A0A4Y2ABA7_ARAVE|nr:hypothetical protein AVEN_53286-1 [Araneus ventricosus]
MDWPAYSPDLNPIEHVWDMLGRRIAARQPPPTCLPELRRELLDEWCNIPQDQIDNLILSMPRRYFRYGNCITFNQKALNRVPLRISKVGIGSGLILNLNLQTHKYIHTTTTVGARIIIHDPNEIPNSEDEGFIFGPGYEASIALKHTIHRRLPAPYEDKCKDYKHETEDFVNSQKACIRSCIQEENFSKCGCADPTSTVVDESK